MSKSARRDGPTPEKEKPQEGIAKAALCGEHGAHGSASQRHSEIS